MNEFTYKDWSNLNRSKKSCNKKSYETILYNLS